MSLRYEQYMALKRTKNFLRCLLTVSECPKTKKEMRAEASACLRHFPFLHDNGQPMWSKDDLTEDVHD